MVHEKTLHDDAYIGRNGLLTGYVADGGDLRLQPLPGGAGRRGAPERPAQRGGLLLQPAQ